MAVTKFKKKSTQVVYPMQDDRIPNVTSAESGKFLGVDNNGDFIFANAGGGGAQLYNHLLKVKIDNHDYWFYVISNSDTQINDTALFFVAYGSSEGYAGIGPYITGDAGDGTDTTILYQLYNAEGKSGAPTIEFGRKNSFNNQDFYLFSRSWPGGTVSVAKYSADKIDTTTGEMLARTAISTSPITIVEDVVTAL